MIDEAAEEPLEGAPVWPAFGDLMACLFGIFVLFFVWAIAFQVDLTKDLEAEKKQRAEDAAKLASAEVDKARLETLESALAGPLADGRITLTDGKIGIRGSVLFGLNSADLREEGAAILEGLGPPLRAYLAQHEEAIMVSGFTDSSPIVTGASAFKDNLELSAARAMTVTRALMEAGIPKEAIFAAGFGDAHPIAPNDTAENRAKNRRVEISPVPLHASGAVSPAGSPPSAPSAP
ncbi:MAG: OmpA family protein [Polyangiaceae bacterium]